jgi:hypothetical protein
MSSPTSFFEVMKFICTPSLSSFIYYFADFFMTPCLATIAFLLFCDKSTPDRILMARRYMKFSILNEKNSNEEIESVLLLWQLGLLMSSQRANKSTRG